MEIVGCALAAVALVWVVLNHLRLTKGPDDLKARLEDIEDGISIRAGQNLEGRLVKIEALSHDVSNELKTLKSSLALKQSFGK